MRSMLRLGDAGLTQPVGGALHEIERLARGRSPCCTRGDSVLYAEAGAVDTDRGERADELVVDLARVELDGVFLQLGEIEQRGKPRRDGLQPGRTED